MSKSTQAQKVIEAVKESASIDRVITLSQGGNACMIWLSGGVRGGAHRNRQARERDFHDGRSRKCKHRAQRGW